MLRVNEATPRNRGARLSNRPPTLAPLPLHGTERLGPYQLCFEIASGGMATLYLARVDLLAGIHRFVALKQIHPHLMKDPAFVEMFLDEARIASQISHANVCSVFDFGVADGTYFIAMEYLSGEPLSMVRLALLGRPDLPNGEKLATLAARIIADAAEGIHAAHELCDPAGVPLNVVHRDVSPDNVFLTYDGVVKIVDFGVARARRQKHKTRTGVLKGKYAYIQPEALRGERTDRRGDVWGLGVILWELLTLKRLFQRKTDVDTLKAVLDSPIPPPSSVRPDLPPELDAIVARALARDPRERYQTARELGRDLTRFLAERRTAVGLAELSEFMSELFPGGAARKRQLVEIAERVEGEAPKPASWKVEREAPGPRGEDDDDESSRRTLVRQTPLTTPSRRPERIGIAVLALMALVVAGWFAFRSFYREANAAPAAAAPSPPVAASLPPASPPTTTASESAMPIHVGTGTVVLEIAPGDPSTKSEGVTVRVRSEPKPSSSAPAPAGSP